MDVIMEPILIRFKVLDFLERPEINGQSIDSNQFTVTDLKGKSGNFVLKIYPKGDCSKNQGFVSIYLNNKSNTVLHLSYELSLEDKDGKQHKIRTSKNRKYSLKKKRCWGFGKFLSIEDLKERANTILPNGVLTLVLEIIKPGPEPAADCFVKDMETVWLDEEFSDIKISSNGKLFSCHRNILSARSPVLRAMCQTNFKEGVTREINMNSMDTEIVEEMLLFIYSGKVKNMVAHAIELLKAADIYQLDNLKDICGHHLSTRLNQDNCLDYLVLGDIYRAKNLKDSSMVVVKEEIKSLMMTPKWKEIRKEHPQLIIDLMESAIH